MSERETAAQDICAVGQRMYQRNMVAANDGNISVRLHDGSFLCTPTGVSKGTLTPEQLCRVDENGQVLESSGAFRPSSEIKMHLRVYRERPDVQSVVHAHPMYATAFAIAGIPLTAPIMPEAVINLGCVPIAAYGTPSTEEIPDAVARFLPHFDAVLLANHGALSYGPSLTAAFFKMESLEFYAELLYRTRQLGGARELSPAQVARLYEIRKSMGADGKHPGEICIRTESGCGVCPYAAPI